MPSDGFPFPIFVGRNPEVICLCKSLLQASDDCLLLLGYFVRRSEIVVGINAELPFWEIADMSHACFHKEVFPEEALDRPGLCGTLDDEEVGSHGGMRE